MGAKSSLWCNSTQAYSILRERWNNISSNGSILLLLCSLGRNSVSIDPTAVKYCTLCGSNKKKNTKKKVSISPSTSILLRLDPVSVWCHTRNSKLSTFVLVLFSYFGNNHNYNMLLLFKRKMWRTPSVHPWEQHQCVPLNCSAYINSEWSLIILAFSRCHSCLCLLHFYVNHFTFMCSLCCSCKQKWEKSWCY